MLEQARVMAILPAADIDRARAFYREKLGLRAVDAPGDAEDLTFEGADGTMLYVYAKEGGTKADHTAAGWLVEDIEEVVAELRERGVVFEQYDRPDLKTNELGIAEVAGERAAWFKDSEGNILAITEMSR